MLCVQLFDMLDLQAGNQLVGRMFVERLCLGHLQGLEPAQCHGLSGRARVEALETEHQRRALVHQAHAPAQ